MELPFTVGQPKITVKSIIDDFRSQLPSNFEGLFEAFVLLSPKKVRVTCRNNRALEDVCNLGLTYRNSPVTFRPCRSAKWVNITRLSYGVPNKAITEGLTPCGKVLNIKMDAYKGIYIGVRNVLIEITTPIPSSIRIAEHWCNAFYPKQTPTCFACQRTGHTRANCPDVQPPRIPAVETAASEDLPSQQDDLPRQQDAPGASHEGSQILGSSVRDTPSLSTSTKPATYASATKAVPPTQPTSVVPTDPVSMQAMDEEQEIEVDLFDPEDSDAREESNEAVSHIGPVGAAAHTDAAHCGISAVVATDQPPLAEGSDPPEVTENHKPPLVEEKAADEVKDHDHGLEEKTRDADGEDDDDNDAEDDDDDDDEVDHDDDSDGEADAKDGQDDDHGDSNHGSIHSEDNHDANDHAVDRSRDLNILDTGDEDDDDLFRDAQTTFAPVPPRKRDHSDDSASDSSTSSLVHHQKKGKVIAEALSRLVSSPDLPASPILFPDTPTNPVNPSEKLSSAPTNDSTDYPLTQATPVHKSTPASQESSSAFEMFLSKKTRPRPVFGTGHVTRSKSASQSRGDSSKQSSC